mgnify:CR=1 FL=1
MPSPIEATEAKLSNPPINLLSPPLKALSISLSTDTTAYLRLTTCWVISANSLELLWPLEAN